MWVLHSQFLIFSLSFSSSSWCRLTVCSLWKYASAHNCRQRVRLRLVFACRISLRHKFLFLMRTHGFSLSEPLMKFSLGMTASVKKEGISNIVRNNWKPKVWKMKGTLFPNCQNKCKKFIHYRGVIITVDAVVIWEGMRRGFLCVRARVGYTVAY